MLNSTLSQYSVLPSLYWNKLFDTFDFSPFNGDNRHQRKDNKFNDGAQNNRLFNRNEVNKQGTH